MLCQTKILSGIQVFIIQTRDQAKHNTSSDSWFARPGHVRSLDKKGRGGISIQLLYNILYNNDDYTPYYSPVTYRVRYYF